LIFSFFPYDTSFSFADEDIRRAKGKFGVKVQMGRKEETLIGKMKKKRKDVFFFFLYV
jgi:hypothetical protein